MSVSRRTIAKGAAWAVPVIVVGAAAPVAAASVPPPVFDPAKFCKRPGSVNDWAYAFYFTSDTAWASAECVTPGWDVPTAILTNQCGSYVQIEPNGNSAEPQVDLTFVFVGPYGETATATALAPDHWAPCQSIGCR